MSTRLLSVILCIAVFVGVMAAEEKVWELEEVVRFKIGDGDGEVGYDPELARETGAATDPLLGSWEEGLLVYDAVNRRVWYMDWEWEIKRGVMVEKANGLLLYPHEADGGVLVLEIWYQGILLVRDGEEIRIPLFKFPELRDYRSWWYYEGVLFVQDAEGRLWSIPEPEVDEEATGRKVLDEAGTRRYVEERWGDSGEVEVDDEGRLFIKGELATRDYATWFEYRTGEKIDAYRPNKYLGKDTDGNEYWGDIADVVVYPPEDGKDITLIELDLSKTSGAVALDRETGDLYVLGVPEGDEIPLYRIRRDW